MGKVTRSIVGLTKEESEALLGFLYNHIGRGIDYQARVKWEPKTVVLWDVSSLSLYILHSPSPFIFFLKKRKGFLPDKQYVKTNSIN